MVSSSYCQCLTTTGVPILLALTALCINTIPASAASLAGDGWQPQSPSWPVSNQAFNLRDTAEAIRGAPKTPDRDDGMSTRNPVSILLLNLFRPLNLKCM